MKKLLCLMLLIPLLAVAGYSQQISEVPGQDVQIKFDSISSVTDSNWIPIGKYGVQTHTLTITPVGTVATLNVSLLCSPDQSATSTIGSALTNTAGGQITGTGQCAYIKVHMTTLTGGGSITPSYVGSTSGGLGSSVTVTSSALPTGAATAANQTSGNERTQICDATTPTNCAPVDPTNGLKVQATISTSGLATSANQSTEITNTTPLVTSGGGGYVRQDSTATIAKESGGNLASAKTDLDTVVTNTNTLAASGAGGYVRQDSTATIAKESGGNLAGLATHQTDGTQKTQRVDGSGNVSPAGDTSGHSVYAGQGTAAAVGSGWPVTDGAPSQQSCTWTTSTSLNTLCTITMSGYSSIYVQASQGANLTAGALTFQLTDGGGNYALKQLSREDVATAETTYTLVSGAIQAWEGTVAGATTFAVKLSTAITTSSGSGSTTITITATAFPSVKTITAGQSNGANLHADIDALPAATGPQTSSNSDSVAQCTLCTWAVNESQIGGSSYALGPATAAAAAPTVLSYASLQSGTVTSAMTGTTSTQVIAAVASNYLYVDWCVVSNGSTTVSTDILLQNGSGGTTIAVLPAPAGAVATTGGGGGMFTFPHPLKVQTAGNGLYGANVTTGSSTKITCGGFASTVSY